MRYLRAVRPGAVLLLLIGLCLGLDSQAQPAAKKVPAAAPPSISAEESAFFESSIRPMLAEKCYSCHSATDQRGGLRLDSREAMLKGNAHGPVLAPGDVEKSIILQGNILYRQNPDAPSPANCARRSLQHWLSG